MDSTAVVDPRVESMIGSVGVDELESVLKSVLEDPTAVLSGTPDWHEISAVHNDSRTIAIVRCSGRADSGGSKQDWSAVVKVIDLSVEANTAAVWMDPTIEEKVYELGLMTDTGTPFRPAKCYRVSHRDEYIKLIWLEDLTGARQPPWTLDEYLRVARHLGEFNGRAFVEPPELPFELPVDVHRARFESTRQMFVPGLASLKENESHPLVRTAMRDVSVDAVLQFDELWNRLIESSPGLPHGIAFGDSHARNMFPLPAETVTVDWSGLAREPVGADLSVLIGSAFSWSLDEGVMVGQREPEIFDAYMEGLISGGWTGNREDVRRALFTHMPLYLILNSMLPDGIRSGRANQRKDWIEARRGDTFENLPERIAPINALIPGYLDELRALLD